MLFQAHQISLGTNHNQDRTAEALPAESKAYNTSKEKTKNFFSGQKWYHHLLYMKERVHREGEPGASTEDGACK